MYRIAPSSHTTAFHRLRTSPHPLNCLCSFFPPDKVAGREPTAPIYGNEVPSVATVNAWDGSDAPAMELEDEIDLSELDDVDLDEDSPKKTEL